MRVRDIIREEHRNVLYHYTSAWAVSKMLEEGRIGLTVATGSDIQAGSHNSYKLYFLSATRSKVGHYSQAHERSTGGVVLVLSADFLRRNQMVRPVDYWGRDFRLAAPTRNEMEERVYSREPYLPLPPNPQDLILEVHLYIGPDTDDRYRKALFSMIVGVKRAGIPLFVYQESRAWLLQDKRRALPHQEVVKILKGIPIQPPFARASFRRPSTFGGYIELFKRPVEDRERLTPKGEHALRNLTPWGIARGDAKRSIEADIHNERSPNSLHHQDLVDFIQFLRQNNYRDVNQFLADLSRKWYSDENS